MVISDTSFVIHEVGDFVHYVMGTLLVKLKLVYLLHSKLKYEISPFQRALSWEEYQLYFSLKIKFFL